LSLAVNLEQLLKQRQDLWRGRAVPAAAPRGVTTGFAALDALLAWRGWPPAALTEVLEQWPGSAFGLAVPALVRLSTEARWLLLAAPPLVPYAPALKAAGIDLSRLAVIEAGTDTVWAMDQGLRSGACSAVLHWGGDWGIAALRRLQLAAQAGNALALLFRSQRAAQEHSPAALRLQVCPSFAGAQLTVLKQRGGRAGITLDVSLGESVLARPFMAACTRRAPGGIASADKSAFPGPRSASRRGGSRST
jgi:cell division inhibitor SulA